MTAPVTPRKTCVLVVDDEANVRLLIATILEIEGYEVLTADCGHAALEIALECHPDVVTLDIMMPDMDGWEVARQLSLDPRTADIRQMVVSAKPKGELEEERAGRHVDAVLTKPFDFTAFVETLQIVLDAGGTVPAQRSSSI